MEKKDSLKPNPVVLKLPRTVIGLGLVSLFTDTSSEAIFPLLPAFLALIGSSNAFIGLVEGAADLVANILKYLTGFLVDRRARLKPLVLWGYGISTIVRPLVAFAFAPWHVLLVRIGDRVGKGVRTTPRDALIANATDPSIRARAYGFHRAMDHAGAAIGTLLAAGLLWHIGANGAAAASADQLRTVFLWAAVPGLLAMIALSVTREPWIASDAAGAETSAFAHHTLCLRQCNRCFYPRQSRAAGCVADCGSFPVACSPYCEGIDCDGWRTTRGRVREANCSGPWMDSLCLYLGGRRLCAEHRDAFYPDCRLWDIARSG
jgi:hypothetical protein